MQKKSIHKLSVPTEEPSLWLGISSHENDYRLSWALNQHLNINLVKSENHSVFNQKLNQNQEFSEYGYQNEQDIRFRLISNRCENGFLLEEFKNIDFIFIVQPDEGDTFTSGLLSRIKGISLVSAVFPLSVKSDKGRKRIL
jgi:hypothetical protein